MDTYTILFLLKHCSLFLLVPITLFLLLHDWIHLPPYTDLTAIRQEHSKKAIALQTLVNSSFVMLHCIILYLYRFEKIPMYLMYYLLCYQFLFVIGILFSWWLPYFFGWPKNQVQELKRTFDGTWAFLPQRKNNPIPNGIHVLFHILFIANTLITCIIMRVQ